MMVEPSEVTRKKIEIRDFWNSQAEKYGQDSWASTRDTLVKELEIRTLLQYCQDNDRILDAGCGNGQTIVELAQKVKATFIGFDFSYSMIEVAKRRNLANLIGTVEFFVNDIDNPQIKWSGFDKVITERCLINLPSREMQVAAILRIHDMLKSDGLFLMMEDTLQGLQKLNALRKEAGLYEIKTPWHNLYIDEDYILDAIKNEFDLIEINNFSSTYYIGSRIFNAVQTPEGQEPDYLSKINRVAAKLPAIGDYGYLKLFVLRKK